MRIALIVAALAGTAHAGDLCAPGAVHRGAPIDLDLDRAQVRGALRLVADAGRVSLVVADDVTGAVTLHLHAVPWDAAACAIAALAHVELDLADRILVAKKR
jgi:type II secretory pathway component HofQ